MKIKAIILRDMQAHPVALSANLICTICLGIFFWFFYFPQWKIGEGHFHWLMLLMLNLNLITLGKDHMKFFQSLPIKRSFFNEVYLANAGEYLFFFLCLIFAFLKPILQGYYSLPFVFLEFLYHGTYFTILFHTKKGERKKEQYLPVSYFLTCILVYRYPHHAVLLLLLNILFFFLCTLFFARVYPTQSRVVFATKNSPPLRILFQNLCKPFFQSLFSTGLYFFIFAGSRLLFSDSIDASLYLKFAISAIFGICVFYHQNDWKFLLSLPISPLQLTFYSELVRMILSAFFCLGEIIFLHLMGHPLSTYFQPFIMGIAIGLLLSEGWLYFIFWCHSFPIFGRWILAVFAYFFTYFLFSSNVFFPALFSILLICLSLITTPFALYHQLKKLGPIIIKEFMKPENV